MTACLREQLDYLLHSDNLYLSGPQLILNGSAFMLTATMHKKAVVNLNIVSS